MNIAVATSLFAENNFDEFLTLNFAEKKKIPAIQLYMNAKLQSNIGKIEKIRDVCRAQKIKVLCHSPKMLGEVSDDSEHCKALASIFYDDSPKYCIFHFTEDIEIEKMVNDCEKLISFGIIPCVENFHIHKTRIWLIVNLVKYLSFFDKISQKGLVVLPVWDFPRLFIAKFINYAPAILFQVVLKHFAHKKIIIHAIDSLSPRLKRSEWCALGRGIVAWNDIFSFLKENDISVEYTVLEYENTDFIDESIDYLAKYGG